MNVRSEHPCFNDDSLWSNINMHTLHHCYLRVLRDDSSNTDVFDKIFNPTNCVVTQDYDNDFGTHCIRLSAYILTGMQMYAVFSPKRSPES